MQPIFDEFKSVALMTKSMLRDGNSYRPSEKEIQICKDLLVRCRKFIQQNIIDAIPKAASVSPLKKINKNEQLDIQ